MTSHAPPLVHAPPGFTYDFSEWPLFITKRTQVPTHQAYRQHLATLDGLLARKEKQVHIIEVFSDAPADRTHMKLQAEWTDSRGEALKLYCLGVGMVLHSAIQRFGIATMLILMRRPIPYQVFSSHEAAVLWGRQLVKKAHASAR